jgi:hypothetical protein
MSTVGKSPDTAWRALLATKGLSAAAPILEDYGLSCENDMSLLDQDDLMTLCSTELKQFPSKLLRKWVQGLVDEQRAAADMNDAPAANKHSNSTHPLQRRGRALGGERGLDLPQLGKKF